MNAFPQSGNLAFQKANLDTCLSELCQTTLNLYRTLSTVLHKKRKLQYLLRPSSTRRGCLQTCLSPLRLIRLDLQRTWNEVLNNIKWLLWEPLYPLPTTSTNQGFRSRFVLIKIPAECFTQLLTAHAQLLFQVRQRGCVSAVIDSCHRCGFITNTNKGSQFRAYKAFHLTV